MEIEQTREKTVVHCGKEMNVATVLDQHRLLFQALQSKKPIFLAGSTLNVIDTAGIQLLVSFCKTLSASKIPWKWENTSSTLKEYAMLSGANRWLNLPTEERP